MTVLVLVYRILTMWENIADRNKTAWKTTWLAVVTFVLLSEQ